MPNSGRKTTSVLPFTDASAPPLVARAIIVVACAAGIAGLVFLFFGRTDVVIKGQATVVPSTESARLQASVAGTVASIAARDGATMRRGDVMLVLDAAEHEAKLGVLQAPIDSTSARIATLEQLLESRGDLFDSEGDLKSVASRVASAQLEAARERELAVNMESELRDLTRSRTEDLASQGVLSTRDMEDARLQAQAAEADAARARAGVRELRAELQRLSIERQRADQSAIVAALQDRLSLAEARERHATLRGLVAETELLLERSKVRAPADGVVQGLTVHNEGEVVQAGQTLGSIIPTEGGLLAQMRVPSTGIGFVREGLAARVKLDAYPYQDYGAAEGKVVWVSPDAVRDAGDDRSVFYDAHLRLTQLPSDAGEELPLRAGMTGQGELVIRQDRIIRAVLGSD